MDAPGADVSTLTQSPTGSHGGLSGRYFMGRVSIDPVEVPAVVCTLAKPSRRRVATPVVQLRSLVPLRAEKKKRNSSPITTKPPPTLCTLP